MNVKDETDVRKRVQQHLDWAANKVSRIANTISNASMMNSQEKSLDEIFEALSLLFAMSEDLGLILEEACLIESELLDMRIKD